MTEPPLSLRRADADTIDHVERLLEAHDLPTEAIHSKAECFFLASTDAGFVGLGGVERYGSNGLLRSVVIVESSRGGGFGTLLCAELERRARANGVTTLYLLTTTAEPFFRRCGYEGIDRKSVPAPIKEHEEFTDLCPATATCMTKDIGD